MLLLELLVVDAEINPKRANESRKGTKEENPKRTKEENRRRAKEDKQSNHL